MFDIVKLKAQLTPEEGLKYFVYDDATGLPPTVRGNLTVGIGHNLTAKGISEAVVDLLFQEDTAYCDSELTANIPCYPNLSEVRQRVLADMWFNMGLGGLLTFKKMLGFLEIGDYNSAADQILLSNLAVTEKTRAINLSLMMRTNNG